MNRISFLAPLALCLLFGCGKNTQEARRSTPEEQVKAIYAELLPRYLADSIPDPTDTEEKYCTEEWKRLREQEQVHADSTGEIGAIDYDLWLNAQDWDSDLALRSVERFREVSEDTVWVKVCLTNCGEQNEIYLLMTYEDSQWRTDDFPYLFDDEWQSPKANLKEFIEEEP